MARKDKNVTPSVTAVLQNLGYNVADWDDSQSETKITKEVKTVLATASKKESGKIGFPDRIFVDVHEKFLVLVEEKPAIKDHDLTDKEKGAVSGIKWYLSRFYNSSLDQKLRNYFNSWKIIGIAVSGDLLTEYQHKFNCFTVDVVNEKILSLNQVTNFLTKEQFLALFNSLDEENAVAKVGNSSKKINTLLRPIDSQKRPVLLSALMISLYKSNNFTNNFPEHYNSYTGSEIITNLWPTVENILKSEGIPDEKLKALKTELAFLDTDQTLQTTDILKEILTELSTVVIPLFSGRFASNSNYDIIGKFYEEFLKYAGVSNVKKGIVLTPRHIASLFTKIVPLKSDDKIVDFCCGTGAFLIAGMNALINQISKSNRTDKDEAIANVKAKQLLGFELNPTMYICAVSNMLFRGDGKSSIHNYDSIRNLHAQEELNKFKATIGFINPPYSGKENREDPTPKEITFLTKMLDNCSRYGVIIAPISTYFKENQIRENILTRHTLRCVINMPSDLFQPNASTHTAVAVFETNRPFDYDKDEVTFYDLHDDGFVLAKNKGRTDVYGRWAEKEKELLDALKPTSTPNDITLVRTKIKPGDEWTIYAHSKTDYSDLNDNDFISPISEYVLFEAKRDLGLLNNSISEIELFEAVGNYFSGNNGISINTKKRLKNKVIITEWQEFEMVSLFKMTAGKYYPAISYNDGDTPLISASETDNGVMTITDIDPVCSGNCLTIGKVGMSIYYQDKPFCASSDVTILEPLFKGFNKHVAMFIIGLLSKQKHQWNYGNQIRLNDSQRLKIMLPIIKKDEPDWQYMENYIKSLPYGEYL